MRCVCCNRLCDVFVAIGCEMCLVAIGCVMFGCNRLCDVFVAIGCVMCLVTTGCVVSLKC